jgi:hypothetical protein
MPHDVHIFAMLNIFVLQILTQQFLESIMLQMKNKKIVINEFPTMQEGLCTHHHLLSFFAAIQLFLDH